MRPWIALCWIVAVFAAGPGRAGDGNLLTAAYKGDLATAERLIAGGADLEVRDPQGRTPLMIATRRNDVALATRLIAAGADVNAKDRLQDTPYLYAGAEGRLEILRLTLANGADLQDTNRYGGTALTPAAHHGHLDVVKELVKTGIDLDQVNHLGWTALLEAVILGDGGPVHTAIVGQLLDAGADPNLADGNGVTPLAHARERGYDAIAERVMAAGGR